MQLKEAASAFLECGVAQGCKQAMMAWAQRSLQTPLGDCAKPGFDNSSTNNIRQTMRTPFYAEARTDTSPCYVFFVGLKILPLGTVHFRLHLLEGCFSTGA